MQIHIQQIGPGMVQQIQTVCIECKGQGERINPKDRCENCSGAKVTREKKIIEVHVEKGEAEHSVLEGPTLLITARSGCRCQGWGSVWQHVYRTKAARSPFSGHLSMTWPVTNEVIEKLLRSFSYALKVLPLESVQLPLPVLSMYSLGIF